MLHDFPELWPEKFRNKTNGVTPRRWMVLAIRASRSLITEAHRRRLDHATSTSCATRAAGRRRRSSAPSGAQIKRANKDEFAALRPAAHGRHASTRTSMFDVQVKRIHEYKRQHLNILHVIALYHRLKSGSGSRMAAAHVHLRRQGGAGLSPGEAHHQADQRRGRVRRARSAGARRLQVVFLPNFNVTNGQRIYPAADLSEQISTAGKEASGTGNMKFSLNGALTIGTLDGANIEICEEVGAENFFLFGLTAHEVAAAQGAKATGPMDCYRDEPDAARVIDLIAAGFFSRGDTTQFRPLIDNLLSSDPYSGAGGLRALSRVPAARVARPTATRGWTRMSILNAARSGKFSSDRTIREYCDDIWRVEPVPIRLLSQEEVKSGFLQ